MIDVPWSDLLVEEIVSSTDWIGQQQREKIQTTIL